MTSRFDKLFEETEEIFGPYSRMRTGDVENLSDEQRDYFARECVDVIMVSLGIIAGLGESFDVLFQEKMAELGEKYPPEVIGFLRRRGMSADEAMAHTKQQWNERRDSGQTRITYKKV